MKLVYAVYRRTIMKTDVVNLLDQESLQCDPFIHHWRFPERIPFVIGVESRSRRSDRPDQNGSADSTKSLTVNIPYILRYHRHGELCHHAYLLTVRSRRRYHFCDPM